MASNLANDWVNSLDNPTRAKYEAHILWQQGLRSSDRTILNLQYGYNDHECDILCAILENAERVADHNLKEFNPEIGF